MPAPAEKKSLLCEQCGAPLQTRAGEDGCLNCLLTAGIEPAEGTTSAASKTEETRFYQHYEILTRPDGSRWEVGRGAMGVTYKARDRNLDTPVALKIINAHFASRPEARRRFLHEAKAAARLRHPNVASVFHFGTINSLPDPSGSKLVAEENPDEGDCFYAMEFVEGETLEARLRRAGPLRPVAALQLAMQVTRALAAAEKRGLVHRDLKPANIMLATEEEAPSARGSHGDSWVKVIDFGLAQLDRTEPSGSGQFFGTLAFSSPEQIQSKAVDACSDIYSLGVTLWYSLTGKVPFSYSSADSARAAAATPLPIAQLAGRGVPTPIRVLLESMLAHDPEDRPASAVALGEALQDCLESLSTRRNRSRWIGAALGRPVLAGALGVAAAVLLAMAIYFSHPGPPPDDKSIAVLPFKNLSHDPANFFLTEGLEDDILSRLVKIRDLKVISRLSSSRYPAEARRDLREIERSLGVRHVLQGSLRRDGNRVLLHVELIDTRDGHELWAQSYDRTLANAITLQGELATTIAEELNATLTPQEKVDVRAKPTGNPGAYVLYLRGRKFENSPTFAVSDFEEAQVLYSQAIALDPGFALAHARRGATLAYLYRFRGPSEELKRTAHAEINEALRLQPDLGEAHLANGLCYYRIERDFNRSLPELETARRLLPNDTEAESFIAYIKRRSGRFAEARAMLEHVLARDPRNVTYAEELYTTGYLLRDWDLAERNIKLAEAIAPTTPLLKVERALVPLWRDGNLGPLQKVFADLKTYGDPEGTLAWMRWDAAMLARDFPAAQAAIDSFPFETLPSVYAAPVPKSYLEGCIALAQGKNAEAQVLFEASRPVMEAETIAHPENPLRHARLGLLYAYMGRRSAALREGQRAVELNPVSEDHFDGPEQLSILALIHARVGDNDQAISMIQSLLTMPGGVFFYEASMSWWELRLRWQWDVLREDPRFQKILAEPEPVTVF
ncbi:MAG: protein kinase [Chthoniobacterales bacterium]